MSFLDNAAINSQWITLGLLTGNDISVIQGSLQLIFSSDKLKVRHISISGLSDD